MVGTRPAAKQKAANPLDDRMTSAQIARRRFKASLPRKIQDRELSVHGALGETFTLLDTFRSLSPDPDKTIMAALAYHRGSNPAKLAELLIVPDPAKVGEFCDRVAALAPHKPKFLGLLFVHVDTETKNPAYKAVSFAVPFMGGAEAAARLHFAQKELLGQQQKVLEGLHA